jgi:dUTP pyrophosphatase
MSLAVVKRLNFLTERINEVFNERYVLPTPTVRFRRKFPDAVVPTRATEGAACWDLYALTDCFLSASRSRVIVYTGIDIELPPGFVGLVCSRSGLAATDGIFVLNAPGVIDEDYRGELKVILGLQPRDINWPALEPIHIPKGSRVAQLMVLPLPQLAVEEVTELSTTDRGEGGLGSTGL